MEPHEDTSIRMRSIIKCHPILCSVFDAYEKIAELPVEDSIKNELSGDFERLMLAVGKKHSESTAFHHNMGNGKLFISSWFFTQSSALGVFPCSSPSAFTSQ